jgi:osmotically-inducible protein OsmY
MCKQNNRTGARRADRELATAASDAIKLLTTIPQETITVTARNGHLGLGGKVDSLHQRLVIEDVARTLHGVRAVTNLIYVEAEPAPADLYQMRP